MIYMTATEHIWGFPDLWFAYCTCGWTGDRKPTQDVARRDGDAHLASAHQQGLRGRPGV